MKNLKLTILLTMLMSMIGTKMFAYQACIDGFYYNFSGSEATVTYKNYSQWTYWADYSGNVVIPETVTYDKHIYNVTAIGEGAFFGSDVTSVTIPNSVTSIGELAFYSCLDLTSVNIGNGVTSIGELAFGYCDNLTSINLPVSLTNIGNHAFLNSALTSIFIPLSVMSIGNNPFWQCTNMVSIVVDSANPIYDSRNNCNALIETASNTLLSGCKKTIIPDGVSSIADSVFFYCLGLTSVTIPNSVTRIGKEAFYSCHDLTSVNIGDGVASIGEFAFGDCSGLTSMSIPNSVMNIEKGAFSSCGNLKSLVIGSGVTCIGSNAFSDCNNLLTVRMELLEPISIEETTFYPYRGGTMLYVPYGSRAAYEDANYWKDFKEIIEFGDISGDGVVDVSDYIGVANHILGNTPAGFNALAADVNNDNVIDISDYIGIANIILTGSIYGNNASSRPLMESEEPTQEPQ